MGFWLGDTNGGVKVFLTQWKLQAKFFQLTGAYAYAAELDSPAGAAAISVAFYCLLLLWFLSSKEEI